MRARLEPFATGEAGGRPIRCRLCGRTFSKWNGTSNHGYAHERRLEATSELEKGGQQWRARFFLK